MHLVESAASHLAFLENWLSELAPFELQEAIKQEGPDAVAIVCVDLINGFCREGVLASARAAQAIRPIVELIEGAHRLGVQHVAFVQDAHPEGAEEFKAYPPHCIRGSEESRAVSELETLSGWSSFAHFEKNSISSLEHTELSAWLERCSPKLVIAVGVVTDLCLYSLALGVKLRSIARGLSWRVLVPADGTQTWDAPDHPGDLYHALFLYQLRRNGVEVVARVNL